MVGPLLAVVSPFLMDWSICISDGSRRFVWASVSEYLVCWLVRGLSWFVLVLLVRGDRLLITLSLSGLFPGWCGVDLACWSSSVDRWGVCVCNGLGLW